MILHFRDLDDPDMLLDLRFQRRTRLGGLELRLELLS